MVASDLKDPRLGFVTVTRVDLTPDLRYARVYVSALGEDEKGPSFQALKRASGFIRREVGPTPEGPLLSGDRLSATTAGWTPPIEWPGPSRRPRPRTQPRRRRRRSCRGPERRQRRRRTGARSSPLDGVLVVDKPAGPTSHDIVDRARRAFRIRRIGHTGTLDPFATGVLPLCLGRATRLARFLGDGGEGLSGHHSRGLRHVDRRSDRGAAGGAGSRAPRRAASAGESWPASWAPSEQVSPAYSARRVGGKRLYELARRGEVAPRPARTVTIHAIDLARVGGRPRSRSTCAARREPTSVPSRATWARTWGPAPT